MNSPDWVKEAIFYHIYPLGLLGAPLKNQTNFDPVDRLQNLVPWLDHLEWLGVNAIYLGPVFESSMHGYDTIDYFQIDRRLGSNENMKNLSNEIHKRGMRLILDGVFNHSGRGFWAFQDLLKNGRNSNYINWFHGVNFDRTSPLGDPFDYETWQGYYDLVKLDLAHPAVKEHLLAAVNYWMEEWQIDGLRLDAADCVSLEFWRELRNFSTSRNPDFWLMGEIIHGDYRYWANEEHLHATTNYECYKGLYSSLNDKNLFEIAYALNRQFGQEGIYRDLNLYNFVDNHDVNRIASQLNQPLQLPLLYALLFAMPGIPSIYYGSEWGITGKREKNSDQQLRPALKNQINEDASIYPHLSQTIRKIAQTRQALPALKFGEYKQVLVASQQFAFWRTTHDQHILVALNAADHPVTLNIPDLPASAAYDALNNHSNFQIQNLQLHIELGPFQTVYMNFHSK
jgi:glycosidase